LIETVLSIKNEKAIEKGTQFKFRYIPIPLAAGIVIPFALSTIVLLNSRQYGYLFVLLPIVAAIMTDSGAYFIGVTMGKHRPFPNISPNKTIEGFVGGVITGTAGMMIYGIVITYTTELKVLFPVLFIYGVVGALITETGDLVYSIIKRKCGIKDYGRIFPGHGGALDRFDSMTFVAPAMALLVNFLPAIY